jgi:dTDP-4-amino-4,6-dideoxygalactose transaminase
LWQPLHRSGSQAGAMAWQVTIADQLHAECLSLPCSVGLTESQQDRVITCVRSAASWLAHA